MIRLSHSRERGSIPRRGKLFYLFYRFVRSLASTAEVSRRGDRRILFVDVVTP